MIHRYFALIKDNTVKNIIVLEQEFEDSLLELLSEGYDKAVEYTADRPAYMLGAYDPESGEFSHPSESPPED